MREIKQYTAQNVMVFMADSTDHVTGKTGLTLTVTISKNGGYFTNINPTVTERGYGWYNIALTSSDTDTIGDLIVRATATGADPAERVLSVVANVEADTYNLVNTELDTAISLRLSSTDIRLDILDSAISSRYTVHEFITKILSDLGEPIDGSGFWIRKDVLSAYNYIQKNISQETGNILKTTSTINVASLTPEITIDSEGNMLKIRSGYRVYGGNIYPIAVYTEEQIVNYDIQWQSRTGGLIRGLITDITAEGKARVYPIPNNSDNSIIVTYEKIASDIFREMNIVGDDWNQLSNLRIQGINPNTSLYNSTNNTYEIFWNLTNSGSIRTFTLYKSSAKNPTDIIAQGSRSGDGTIMFTQYNSSGVYGTVDVTYTIDDTDSGNYISLYGIEIPQVDVICLENGVKAMLYSLERDGNDNAKANYYANLYVNSLSDIKNRLMKKRSGTYETITGRGENISIRTRPLYPWEV